MTKKVEAYDFLLKYGSIDFLEIPCIKEFVQHHASLAWDAARKATWDNMSVPKTMDSAAITKAKEQYINKIFNQNNGTDKA